MIDHALANSRATVSTADLDESDKQLIGAMRRRWSATLDSVIVDEATAISKP